MKIQLVISMLVALSGCASASGLPTRVFESESEAAGFSPVPQVDSGTVGTITTGVDDHDAISERIGPPMAKARLRTQPGCDERWVYSRPTMVNGDPKMRILLVDFDASGIVCHSVYRDE